jgi:hypothetical protein
MCTSCKVQINGKGGQFSVAEGGQFYIAEGGQFYIAANKVQKEMRSIYRISQLIPPTGTWTDPFVVPYIETLIMQPLDLRIDGLVIVMGVAHEDVGIIASIGWEGLVHAFFLIILGRFILT